jgi:hypothetical protein
MLGFEWILMTKMPGRPLGEVWKVLSFSAEITFGWGACGVLGFSFRNQLRGIGNVYERLPLGENSTFTETPVDTSVLDEKSTSPRGGIIDSQQYIFLK